MLAREIEAHYLNAAKGFTLQPLDLTKRHAIVLRTGEY